MRASTATSSTNTPKRSWLHTLTVPALCLSALIFVLYCLAIDIGAGHLMETLAGIELESALKSTSDDKISEALKFITQARERRSPLGLFQTSSVETERKDAVIKIALALRAALLKEDRAAIQQALLELSHGYLNREDHPDPSSDSHLSNLRRLIEEKIQLYQQAQASHFEALKFKDSLDESLRSLVTRYELVYQDLSELLSMVLPLHSEIEPFVFYTQGALRELPALINIPDNLQDFVQLREQLERHGGKVRIEGENAHELFVAKLEEIRVIAREIAAQHSELKTNLGTNADAISASKIQLKNRREGLLSSVNNLIAALSER